MLSVGKVLQSNSTVNSLIFHIGKRFKFKKKWATNRAEKSSTELALNHYDFHIGQKLGSRWPSIRLALLSQPKHCAVMNNFCEDLNEFIFELAETGGFDFVERYKYAPPDDGKYSLVDNHISESNNLNGHRENLMNDDKIANDQNNESSMSSPLPNDKTPLVSSKSDLYSFVPAKRILSEREKLQKLELELNSPTDNLNEPNDLFKVIKDSQTLKIPKKLKAIIHNRGDVTKFEPAKKDKVSGKLSYYLMDGGSVLPTLALDLFPNCSVLDMCAAPGGKTYAMLQTMLPDEIVCLDRSYNRMVRLKDTMRMYFPQVYVENENVTVKLADATNFGFDNPDQFDRVLVDVPCYADRHSVTEDENNWFKSSRQADRLLLQQTQQRLLVSAIKACKPGGIIVYSTCTLSPPQNDGTVRSSIEHLYANHNIEVSVIDTGPLVAAYGEHFHFNNDPSFCSLGQLVVPNVTANFGPTYFCKIKRLK